MDRQVEYGVLIAGTGPVGLIAALGLAKSGFAVTLAGPPVRNDDRRTTALMSPALKYLNALGILGKVEPEAAPLSVM
ncbi:UbiH/UbiF family hydroxylase, partial [Rhizobiaceae sp. 2RAB30]